MTFADRIDQARQLIRRLRHPKPDPTAATWLIDDLALRWLLTAIVAIITVATCLVAALAFVASFDAIDDYARRSGGIAPRHAFMAPLFVDSFIVIGALADLWVALTRATGHRAGGRWVALAPKGLIGAAALISYALNIAHAPPTVPAMRVAALPPTALVISELILMSIIRQWARVRLASRQPAEPGMPLQAPSSDSGPTPDVTDTGQDTDMGADEDPSDIARIVADHTAAGGQVHNGRNLDADLVRQVMTARNVGDRHARRLLAPHRAQT